MFLINAKDSVSPDSKPCHPMPPHQPRAEQTSEEIRGTAGPKDEFTFSPRTTGNSSWNLDSVRSLTG